MSRRPTPRSSRRSPGFTILELMVTVAVAGILAAIGIPAMTNWMQNQNLVTATSSLVLSLNYARNEALKRDSAAGVQLCASSDARTCSSANWATGWIVWDVQSGAVLSASPGLSPNMTLTEHVSGQTNVTYLPNGAYQPNGGSSKAQFVACDVRGAAYARELEVNVMGRIVSSPTAGFTVGGVPLTCP